MNIHEHQAKELLKSFGIPVLAGKAIFSPQDARAAAKELEQSPKGSQGPWVVKAQIHAGGRGKAGGVKLARSLEEVATHAREIFGKTLVTHQTGPAGKEVQRLYVEAGCAIKKELYMSLLVDRAKCCVGIIASQAGGMDIEEVAEKTPDKIIKVWIDPATGVQGFHLRDVAFGLGLEGDVAKKFMKMLAGCYKAFMALDASLIEINPFVITEKDDVVALDAKMSFDDSALGRHKNLETLRDLSEEDPAERKAEEFGLNYVKLDGRIGCMVNGAGLAMATMDIIKLYGEEPANFLDVGGGATKETVTEAFKIILSDQSVQGILVNIFGGIMRCDIIANGVVAAAKEVNLAVPLVVRLEGTNVAQGKKILETSGLKLQSADNLAQAAEKIVAAVKGA